MKEEREDIPIRWSFLSLPEMVITIQPRTPGEVSPYIPMMPPAVDWGRVCVVMDSVSPLTLGSGLPLESPGSCQEPGSLPATPCGCHGVGEFPCGCQGAGEFLGAHVRLRLQTVEGMTFYHT